MDKIEIRKSVLTKLKSVSSKQRSLYQHSLFNQMMEYLNHHSYSKIGLYYGFKPEIETPILIDKLANSGYSIYLPRILPNRQLSFNLFNSHEELEVVQKKIKQPTITCPSIPHEKLDLIVVPGLAFSLEGGRLGFGGGYYDRILSDYHGPTISMAFPEQLLDHNLLPLEAHDQFVSKIMIPSIKEG